MTSKGATVTGYVVRIDEEEEQSQNFTPCVHPLVCLTFIEFTREVTDTQMPLVAPVILPEMYKIFTMAEVQKQLLPFSGH